MLVACAVFALSAAGTSAWAAGAVLLGGAALQVSGEMLLAAAGSWEIAFSLAPPDKQGQYQGFFGSSTSIARMLGPLLLTTLIIAGGTSGWFVLGGMFLLAGLAMNPAVRWAERESQARAAGRVDHPAGDPAGVVGGEERHDEGDVRGLPDPAQCGQ